MGRPLFVHDALWLRVLPKADAAVNVQHRTQYRIIRRLRSLEFGLWTDLLVKRRMS